MNAYQPKETVDLQQQGVDDVSLGLKSNDTAGESEVDAAHHRLGGQPKVDSNLSSPNVAVHRSSIATGKCNRRERIVILAWRDVRNAMLYWMLKHYFLSFSCIRYVGGATPIAARESVVRYQMGLRETAFTDLRQITIFLGTYNVNGQPPASGLADWLAVDAEPPDIYAVGFQELDLSKEAFLFNETPREEEVIKINHLIF